MAKKFEVTELSKKELAAQLRKPEGDKGKKVGQQMNKGNKNICLNSYLQLNPSEHSLVLEIGMGNGLYIKDLLGQASGLTYIGYDFSQTMIDEAIAINNDLVKDGKVSFKLGSIDNLPFEDNSIDFITTTNTVYFWPDLKENAQELLRVLKPGGKLLIGYRGKEIMDKVEFTEFGFNKYTKTQVEDCLLVAGFKNVTSIAIPEPDLDFDGEPIKMEGLYTTGLK